MRVIWAGTFRPDVYRNRQWLRLLTRSGGHYRAIREELWGSGELWALGSRRVFVLARMPIYYMRLFGRLLMAPPGDVYLVSYPGWFDIPIVWLVSRIRCKPLVFDPFISLWDTAVVDREVISRGSFANWALRWIDRTALRLADYVVADTDAHLRKYSEIAGRSLKGFVLPVGSDETVFGVLSDEPVDGTLVAFYGTYVPLQGVTTIIRAAHALRSVRFRIIGSGQGRPEVEQLISELQLDNVDLVDPVAYGELPGLLSPAALCLGIFGDSTKADNVIPHKVYDYLAMGKPVITRNSTAVEEMGLFDAMITVPPSDPVALAGAIIDLLSDEAARAKIALRGRMVFQSRYSSHALAFDLARFLEEVSHSRD